MAVAVSSNSSRTSLFFPHWQSVWFCLSSAHRPFGSLRPLSSPFLLPSLGSEFLMRGPGRAADGFLGCSGAHSSQCTCVCCFTPRNISVPQACGGGGQSNGDAAGMSGKRPEGTSARTHGAGTAGSQSGKPAWRSRGWAVSSRASSTGSYKAM